MIKLDYMQPRGSATNRFYNDEWDGQENFTEETET